MSTKIKNVHSANPGEAPDCHHPSLALVLPISTIDTGDKYKNKIDTILSTAEKKLSEKYNAAVVKSTIEKLQDSMRKIKTDTDKTGVAIFISPLYNKLIYLNFPVEEDVTIDEPFGIRDLIYNNQPNQKYVIALLCDKHFSILTGNERGLNRIAVDMPDTLRAYQNDIPGKTANFTDNSERKEIMLDKLLHHADQALTNVLKDFPFPVIIMGAKRTVGHYKELSSNITRIVECIHGSYDEASDSELQSILHPYFINLKKSSEQSFMLQLQNAMDNHKLAYGIHEVWQYATKGNGQLLLIEKSYHYPSNETTLAPEATVSKKDNTAYLLDAIDVIIEKVLECGGEIKFVDKDTLKDYGSVALIRYY